MNFNIMTKAKANHHSDSSPLILIKYGGNAMLNDDLKEGVVHSIEKLYRRGYRVVIVHGGGPFIRQTLGMAGIKSEFIGGHRRTTPEALRYIEMALKGEVSGSLVNLLNRRGLRAVGLSGKDGRMVAARKRYHESRENGVAVRHDLGQVGDVDRVNTELLEILLRNGFLPVVTCLASDEEGNDYNINGDMFAGHLAGALRAERYLILTDVDGLMKDIEDPESLITDITLAELEPLFGTVIQGGMIPKLESCRIALKTGARSAAIINGTKPKQIEKAATAKKIFGTQIQPA